MKVALDLVKFVNEVTGPGPLGEGIDKAAVTRQFSSYRLEELRKEAALKRGQEYRSNGKACEITLDSDLLAVELRKPGAPSRETVLVPWLQVLECERAPTAAKGATKP